MILHTRFDRALVSGVNYAASGVASLVQHLPLPDQMPKKLGKGQYVLTGTEYNLQDDPGPTSFDNNANVLDYNGDIVLKRFRLMPNLPGAFFYSTLNALGFCWFHDLQVVDLNFDQNYCHWTTLTTINVGEWYDINVTLPRNDNLMKDFGHGLYNHPRIGVWHEQGDFHYAGVPLSAQGQPMYITLELEAAMSVDSNNWQGSRA